MGEVPRLRVLTMNVVGPANPDWDRRKRVLADALQALDADVVALQEVPCLDGIAVVHELLGPGYEGQGSPRGADDGVGGVLARRWPHRVLAELDQRLTEGSRDFAWCATSVVE